MSKEVMVIKPCPIAPGGVDTRVYAEGECVILPDDIAESLIAEGFVKDPNGRAKKGKQTPEKAKHTPEG